MNAPRRTLIIGGGLAGPALALLLARSGREAAVFEAYPRGDLLGGGFQIAPNGLRVLDALGLGEALRQQGHLCADMAFRNHRGRDIGVVRTRSAGVALNIARGAVHRLLRDEAERRGVAVRYEKRLRDIAIAGREVVATFEDGSSETGDCLVGADGVRSRVRAWMLPGSAARDTGMISLGGFCARDMPPPEDPRDAERLTFLVGPRYQFGYSKMADEQWAWWCHAHAGDEAERAALLTMPPEALRARMRERYRGWSDPVERLIDATEGWLRTAIQDVPRLPTWRRGPVLLLGDAAHAMSPAGGQGASLALEDAMVLSRLLDRGSASVEEAMARFEALRRPRAEAMVAQAYENDQRTLKHLSPAQQWTRDHLMMPLFARLIERSLRQVYAAPVA